ncbi:GntR family transcriptional regulator [Gordonia crocea]|uniref:Putative GntR transcriptional regulatory protein n=1 Tax=Gordonia crocea TaxID=589162 RepID=A0A7I9UZ98_9ACTN|nr:GntR family transcriptional regulator [Gordonia crocea]GED98498.1 putative GntR transcriptional regulatory protein [Gordonia crocea]
MAIGGGLRRRPQLSEEVAGAIRHRIMTGDYRPGDHIRMDETAADLGVSVTPVREALLTLRGEGMVNLAPHRGYVVADLTRTDVEDIFWLQGQIAIKIALRTAETITDDDLAVLSACNDRLRRAVAAGAVDEIVDAEFDFHRTHNRISHSGKLAWFLLNATHYTPHRIYAADPDWGAVAVDSHDRLIEGYRSGDRTAITDQVRRQFDDGAQRLAVRLTAAGIWDED